MPYRKPALVPYIIIFELPWSPALSIIVLSDCWSYIDNDEIVASFKNTEHTKFKPKSAKTMPSFRSKWPKLYFSPKCLQRTIPSEAGHTYSEGFW